MVINGIGLIRLTKIRLNSIPNLCNNQKKRESFSLNNIKHNEMEVCLYMQIAKAIRKVSAVSAGAVMLGATITGAMAASLSDYPEPFVKNGKYDMLPVYGDTSAGDDIAGAWDILGGLAAGAVSSTGTSGSSLVVSGGESDEIPINSTITAAGFLDPQLDDDDINSFQDSTL